MDKKKKIYRAILDGNDKILYVLNKRVKEYIYSKEEVDLDFFLKHCFNKRIDFNVYLIFPKGKYYKFDFPVFIFPRVFKPYDGSDIRWIIKKNILANGVLYSSSDFEEKFNSNLEEREFCCLLDRQGVVFISFFFLIMTHENFMKFKKEYMTSIRSYLFKQNIIRDNRGKIKTVDDIQKFKKAFVISQYKSLGVNKKRFAIKIIRERLEKKSRDLYPDDENMAEKYCCSESTIRRIIESIKKK